MNKQLAEILINEYYNLFSVTLENTVSKYEACKRAELVDGVEVVKTNEFIID